MRILPIVFLTLFSLPGHARKPSKLKCDRAVEYQGTSSWELQIPEVTLPGAAPLSFKGGSFSKERGALRDANRIEVLDLAQFGACNAVNAARRDQARYYAMLQDYFDLLAKLVNEFNAPLVDPATPKVALKVEDTDPRGAAEAVPRSCADILKRNPEVQNGVYRIDPDGQGPQRGFDAQCNMDWAGGGWTLVAKLDGRTPFYCDGEPGSALDLRFNGLKTGKVPDEQVRQIADAGTHEVLYFLPGQDRFLYSAMSTLYDTGTFYNIATWRCWNGKTDTTTGSEPPGGCGFGARGEAGPTKKLVLDTTNSSGAHDNALHLNGGFCSIDNESQAAAEVYVR